MRSRRLSRCLIYPVLLLTLTPGCQAMHFYRPTPVLAWDADTKKPIPGVEVRVSYPLSNSNLAPWESIATTGADGIARVRAAPFGDAGILVDVTAKGYMNEQKFLTVDQVGAIDKAHWFEDVNRRPPCLTVVMYHEPRPTIELVVPAGYRGIVKARIQVQEDAVLPPGQRLFSYPVPPSGELIMKGPTLFRHVILPDMRIKFADNTPVSRQAQDSMLGYWWLKSESNYNHFLVGAASDFDDYRRSLQSRRVVPNDIPGGRQVDGKGRHKGRGDPTSSDPRPDDNLMLAPSFFDRSTADLLAPVDAAPSPK
jgi:hypothetical protein